MGKLLANCALLRLRIRQMLTQSLAASSMEIFPQVLEPRPLSDSNKGEVEEEEEREDARRCRWQ